MSKNEGVLATVLAGGGLEELQGEGIASSEALWLQSQRGNEKQEPHAAGHSPLSACAERGAMSFIAPCPTPVQCSGFAEASCLNSHLAA